MVQHAMIDVNVEYLKQATEPGSFRQQRTIYANWMANMVPVRHLLN